MGLWGGGREGESLGMKILTQNTWKNEGGYRERMAGLDEELRRAGADVVLLQECFRCTETREDTAGLLAAGLGFGFCYAEGRRKRRWHEGEWRESASGLAVLSRFAIGEVRELALPSTEKGGERLALLARVEAPDGPWWVACAHFSHVRGEVDTRQRQIEATLRALAEAAGGGPAVVGGDCNCEPGCAEIEGAQRVTRIRIQNALVELGVGEATHPWPPDSTRVGRQLDQIWILDTEGGAGVGLLGGGVVAASSDHAGVWVELG